ncbi:MAG: asparaginase [Rhodobiaceae bacterium]|nr:asparaginase [Rhodobiaceae bacterium]
MNKTNPVLVEVTRGGIVESRHRGSIAIANDSGAIVTAIGDVGRAVFPRSSVKAFQALPLVETGAADAFGFTEKELALACSSHIGEDDHVATARAMLAKAGLDETALECGPQWPALPGDIAALHAAKGTWDTVHNNCSGKHSGMLALARHLGVATAGYVKRDHPVQATVRQALEEMTGAALATAPCGLDGCSIPTYAVPLTGLATGFARFATGAGLAPVRARAVARLRDACFAHPEMVAGTGRFCTEVMRLLPGRAFVKTGAEGVYCAAFPTRGIGIALKCDDGTTRASEAMMTAVVLHVLADELTSDEAERLKLVGLPPITDRWGAPAGETLWRGAL